MFSSEHAKLHASLSVNGHGWSALLSPAARVGATAHAASAWREALAAGARLSREHVTLLMAVVTHRAEQAYRPHGASPRSRGNGAFGGAYRARGGDVRRSPACGISHGTRVCTIYNAGGDACLQSYNAHGRHLLAASTRPTPSSTSRTTTRRSTRAAACRDVRLACAALRPVQPVGGAAAPSEMPLPPPSASPSPPAVAKMRLGGARLRVDSRGTRADVGDDYRHQQGVRTRC